jgi:hypothetical protein
MGVCGLCGEHKSKSAMQRHLADCAPRHDPAKGAGAEWIALRVEGGGPYWLDLEVRADARLEVLDAFLRRIWLECCGHMSAFSAGRGDELPMNRPVQAVFADRGTALRHEYDFGSTTELLLKAVGRRTGRSAKSPVRLLARNEPPQLTCGQCGERATDVCPFSEDDNPFLCEAHAPDHDCGESDCHLPVVNSPRMGVCGYTG